MNSKESEYRALFLMEAKDNLEQLDKLYVDLEKDPSNARAIQEVFRIMHTLKGNAQGMGYEAIGDLSHLIEDVMLAIREKKVALNQELFGALFRANDKLHKLVAAVETEEKVSYLGIKTSLSNILKKELENKPEEQPEEVEEMSDQSEELPSDERDESKITFSDVIQVPVKKLDDLLNDVGQLIIERDRLINEGRQQEIAVSELDQLKRLTSSLQYSVMSIRMVQVGFLFNKFHRVLRDAATIENKKVNLTLKGVETEIDRNILKIISDSLVHLIRNAVSHGVEEPEVRKIQGKPEVGEVVLEAAHDRDRVIISVRDDGAGMDCEAIRKKIVEKKLLSAKQAADMPDEEILQYVFESGFSNAQSVNEISGRGVGMDVVKRTIESIDGQVKLVTRIGEGSTIQLHIPASLALKGTLIFSLEHQEYAIALSYTEAVISVKRSDIFKVGRGLVTEFEDSTVPLVFLKDIFALEAGEIAMDKSLFHKSYANLTDHDSLEVIIIKYGNRPIGVVVDKVHRQKDIIEKPLPLPVRNNKLISGAAILGTGHVAPVLDVSYIARMVYHQSLQSNVAI